MSPHNTTIRLALNKALAALFTLEDAGCTVREIRVEGGRPQLLVDRRPPRVLNVMRSGSMFTPQSECFGELMGCRVDWREPTAGHRAEVAR